MNFGEPNNLTYLYLLPFIIGFILWMSYQQRQRIAKLGDSALIGRLMASVNVTGRRWRVLLWLIAIPLLMAATARPQWGTELQRVEQQGVEIMVALDISTSMLAQDIRPDRLSRAKLEIEDLMRRLTGDQIGLVVFSGASFIQFPLTSDYSTARAFLDKAEPNVISQQGTALGDAIRTARRGFDEQRAAQRVIIIMTDGEGHTPEPDPFVMAREAADEDIIIYTIGFGSPAGEPIPEFNNTGERVGFKVDSAGRTILSKLDETTLQQIAQLTDGRYFRARADGQELDALIAELRQLQQETLQAQFKSRPIERFQIFLGFALYSWW